MSEIFELIYIFISSLSCEKSGASRHPPQNNQKMNFYLRFIGLRARFWLRGSNSVSEISCTALYISRLEIQPNSLNSKAIFGPLLIEAKLALLFLGLKLAFGRFNSPWRDLDPASLKLSH
jgi:hypothetical protein